ncbi:SMP-30/gluconolactonase/LRE family protein [Undibacterium flavidum]|uniref:SMP-30/gluconolactonase/LRE family protein n=1 Tax=Undibacterium flavidum TaxID=2762297 RepID=A0ABR6Y7B4_9BURK|nr:SMP-30/gluconolactonase/LRE family protein [Undibacterium flavidum]MBC3872509.1 SMP-30/gluconolactonase/LRE family protein [Undibacterium flavidum]
MNSTQFMSCLLAQQATLGESLLWDSQRQCWWWTDIEASAIYRWRESYVAPTMYSTPDRVGSFVLCQSGKILLGMTKSLALFDINTRQIEPLVQIEIDLPSTRVNDGRTDRVGNYVFGSIDQSPKREGIGHFYQYSMQHGLRQVDLPAVAIANSICFSLDGKTMYFCDTVSQRILQCDYDAASANVSNIRLFVETEKHAYPDGSVIDEQGCLWNAQWGASRVVQYAADGRVLQIVKLPAKNPTCPAFGSAELNQLVLTSSRKDMTATELLQMPEAGGLFGLRLSDVRGVTDTLFNDVAHNPLNDLDD